MNLIAAFAMMAAAVIATSIGRPAWEVMFIALGAWLQAIAYWWKEGK